MKRLLLIALMLATEAGAVPFSQGDAERGAQLFNQFDCNSCHRSRMGGDGNTIFTRPDRRVTQPVHLVEQIKRCSGAVGANLTSQQEQDLGRFLNQRYYKFK